jgi:catecholate siderophore receptor
MAGGVAMSGEKRPRSLRAEQMVSVAAALGAAFVPAMAFADDIEEPVIVLGQRGDANPYADPEAPYKIDELANDLFTEPLLDTPKGVTVLGSDLLGDLGLDTFREVFRAQPGITLGTGEGGNAFGDRIFIRGFDARNDVYVDGVRDPGVGSRETFAVQQIEILRGPSSAFGGRGTTGGAVSLVSKQPTRGTWGDVDITAGDDDTRRVAFDGNHAFTDTFAVRINLMSHTSDVPGRKYVFNDRWGAALAAEWTPIEPLELGFDYFHLSTDYMPDWGVPYDVTTNRPFDVDRENFYGVLSRDFGATFSDIYTLRGAYQVSDNLRLNSILRYGQSGNAYTASAPEQPNNTTVVPGFPPGTWTVSANAKRRDAVTAYWTHQTQLTFEFDTGAWRHALVAGYDLSHEETLNRQRAFTECATLPCTGLAANPRLDLYNPDPTIPFGSDTAITGRSTITTDTAALFAIDTIKFSPQWQLMAGLRYDDYQALTEGLAPDRESQSEFLSWHTGLVYKPTEASTLYLSYSSSSNPPCEQLDSVALDYSGCDTRVVGYDPIDNRSVELGGKINLFDEHLNLTGAIFYIDRTGVPVATGGAASPLALQDQAVSGVELTVAGNITDNWSLFGGVTLLDTEITSSPIPGQTGSAFPNVSETSFALTSRHDITDRLYLGGTATYQSEKFGGTVAAGTTRVPGYWRFDLFGGYEIRDGVELSFNLLNAGDEVYYDALYRSATPFSYIAPGRAFHVTLDIEF